MKQKALKNATLRRNQVLVTKGTNKGSNWNKWTRSNLC